MTMKLGKKYKSSLTFPTSLHATQCMNTTKRDIQNIRKGRCWSWMMEFIKENEGQRFVFQERIAELHEGAAGVARWVKD